MGVVSVVKDHRELVIDSLRESDGETCMRERNSVQLSQYLRAHLHRMLSVC